MHAKNKSTSQKPYIIITVSISIILMCFIVLKLTHESRIFNKYVCNPVPKSVRNIKIHGRDWPSWGIFGYKYVMHFKISKPDLPLVLSSKRFKEIEWLKYKNGFITWGDTPPWETKNEGEHAAHPNWEGYSLGLYPQSDGQAGPAWFKPDDWENPKIYVFRERNTSYQQQIQILIYNEELEEAFLAEDFEGHW